MDTIKMDVMGHLAGIGDEHKGSGEFVGTRGEKKPVEGFSIISLHQEGKLGVRYRATIRNGGESSWCQDGQLAGSRGKKTVLEGLQIELYGKDLALYDIQYMAHVAEMGDTRWYANGEYCGTPGHAIEGFAVRIVQRVPDFITLISQARSASGKQLVITAPAGDGGVKVSATTGDASQLWDKRPVKAGQAYVLVSKARPGKCLAHQGGHNAVGLKDIGLIDRDDSCVWRNDAVPGDFNAINTWTNWEFKLNMRGNPPYADHDNDLILYPWANRAPNELWRPAQHTYNLVSGFDGETLNKVAGSIYQACYPRLFKGDMPIGDGALLSVAYDMSTQPILSLGHGKEVRDTLHQAAVQLKNSLGLEGLTAEQLTDSVSVTALVRDFKLSVQLQDKPLVEVSSTLTLGGALRANVNSSLSLELTLSSLSIPGFEWLEELLRPTFLPALLNILNTEILSHIAIPALEFEDVRLAMPVVATRNAHALAATTRLPDFPAPPPEGNWPRDKVFAGIDATLLEAVAIAALKKFAPHDTWAASSSGFSIDARYGVSFDAVHFDIKPDGGNSYHVQIQVNAGAGFTIDPPILPKFSLGASAYGNIGATAAIEINEEGDINVRITSIDPVILMWQIDSIPSWMQAPIMSMFNLFTSVVANAVAQSLRGITFKLYSVPEIEATIAGKTFGISFKDMQLGSIADSRGKALLLASTVPTVRLIA